MPRSNPRIEPVKIARLIASGADDDLIEVHHIQHGQLQPTRAEAWISDREIELGLFSDWPDGVALVDVGVLGRATVRLPEPIRGRALRPALRCISNDTSLFDADDWNRLAIDVHLDASVFPRDN
jgi:hypothetical protein